MSVAGLEVQVFTDLVAAVVVDSLVAVSDELVRAGAVIIRSPSE